MTTHTSKTPIRIDATHYQIESARKGKEGTFYNQTYNHNTGRWECDCPDAAPQEHGIKYKAANPNCKHRRRLKEYIAEQKALQAGEQPVHAAAQAVLETAQEASIRDEIEALRQELGEAQAIMRQQIDQLRAGLQLETELRQNQTTIFLESSTKQHERENAIIEALNQQAQLIAAQATEIEKLRQDRKLEIAVSVKAPGQRSTTSAKKAKATPPTPAPQPEQPDMEIKELSKHKKYLVDGNLVMYSEDGYATACKCDRNQRQGKQCSHMDALEKFLK